MSESIQPPVADDFSAIGESGDKPIPPDHGSLSEQREYFNDEPRLISQAHRRLRNVAFFLFGGLSVVYLVALLCVLWQIFALESALPYYFAKHHVDWHGWLFVGAALIIFAAIPLSLCMALVRMISDKKEPEERGYGVKTPAVEALKHLADILKSVG